MANYFTLITTAGLAKITTAQLTNSKVEITEVVVGDGNGSAYTPTGTESQLKRVVWRGGVSSVEVDSQNPNWIVVESVIPATDGGFTIREVGLYDAAGTLIAIGNYPDTYKPVLADGSTMDLSLRTIIEVSNASSVTLRIDPNVIVASRKYVDDKVSSFDDRVTAQLAQTTDEVARLDNEKVQKVDGKQLSTNDYTSSEKNLVAQVPTKADKLYVDGLIGGITTITPRDVYYSIVALEAAFPNGDDGLYLVFDSSFTDGAHGFIYSQSESIWKDTGVFQAETVADGSINVEKLAGVYSLHDNLTPSTDVKTIFKEGTFTGVANGNYTNAPPGYTSTQGFNLSVTASFKNSNRWFFYEFTEMIFPFKKWRTLVDKTGQFTYAWRNYDELLDNTVTTSKIVDKNINRTKLSDDFMVNYGYITATGNVNTAIQQGNYVVLAGALNTPIATTTFTLNTEIYRTNTGTFYWVTQTATTADGVARQFVRKMYTQFNNWSEWVEVTNTGSRFNGKTIVVIGDSIVENSNYTTKLATLLGANVISIGFGGCRMTKYGDDALGSLYTKMCMAKLSEYIKTGNYTELETAAQTLFETNADDNRPQVERLKNINWANVHAIIIAFGTNDYGGNIAIGTSSDTTSDTFKGAINLVIDNIASTHKNVQLLFMTPFWRGTYTTAPNDVDSDTYANPLGHKVIDYVDATIERVNAHHYPVYDAYRNIGINRFNQSYYLTDRLHPNNGVGTDLIANKYFGAINAMF